jgi:putative solute:sodium symporter small subunit
MNDSQSHDTAGETGDQVTHGEDNPAVATDGGAASAHEAEDYLDARINLLSPSTGFMRDHLKLVWGSFIAWIITTWGPVTVTLLATDTVTSTSIIGFPAHYFLVAFVAPTSSLVLAAIYAQRRDKLDEKYGINTSGTAETSSGSEDAAATDGGVAE